MVSGRGRAIVIGVGSNTAMGSIRDSMMRTDDVSLSAKTTKHCFGTLLLFHCIEKWVVPTPI